MMCDERRSGLHGAPAECGPTCHNAVAAVSNGASGGEREEGWHP